MPLCPPLLLPTTLSDRAPKNLLERKYTPPYCSLSLATSCPSQQCKTWHLLLLLASHTTSRCNFIYVSLHYQSHTQIRKVIMFYCSPPPGCHHKYFFPSLKDLYFYLSLYQNKNFLISFDRLFMYPKSFLPSINYPSIQQQ